MLKPMGARLVVKRMDAPRPETTIIIPESVGDKPSQFAIVMAVGTKVRESVAVGDTVILKDYVGAPCEVLLDGEIIEALVVNEDDVLAVVEV